MSRMLWPVELWTLMLPGRIRTADYTTISGVLYQTELRER